MRVGSLPNLVIILSILKNEKNPTEYVCLALFSAHKFQVAIWELGQEGEGCKHCQLPLACISFILLQKITHNLIIYRSGNFYITLAGRFPFPAFPPPLAVMTTVAAPAPFNKDSRKFLVPLSQNFCVH